MSKKSKKKTEEKPTRLIRVSHWNYYHKWPPQGGLRHLIFFSEQFGFDKVIRRVGRTILIDEQAFFEWVEERDKKHV